jgi:hypothetical protein
MPVGLKRAGVSSMLGTVKPFSLLQISPIHTESLSDQIQESDSQVNIILMFDLTQNSMLL